MLSAPLNLGIIDAGQLFDYLYSFFHRDFVANPTRLNGQIHIDPLRNRMDEGKEATFWHLTSKEQKRQVKQGNRFVTVKERLPDYRRSERIEWVRQIITNHTNAKIRCFYHQESNEKRDIRLYLWAYADDFVVIMQKLGRSSAFLVTSFYIDHQGKRDDFARRHRHYISGQAQELKGCEWF